MSWIKTSDKLPPPKQLVLIHYMSMPVIAWLDDDGDWRTDEGEDSNTFNAFLFEEVTIFSRLELDPAEIKYWIEIPKSPEE